MIPTGHRVVPFAGQVAGVEWSGTAARDAVALAFGAPVDGDDRLPDVIFRLGARADVPVLTLFDGHTCLYRGTSVGTATHVLLQATLDGLIRTSTDGLVIHAALLRHAGAAVLLPGATGSGKTMLAAWLTMRGLDCLSDEACYFTDRAAPIQGFARPLCFKGPWAERLDLQDIDRAGIAQDDGVSLVPAALLRAPSAPTPAVPRLIVFPRYAAGAPFELARLTPARAAVRLIESVANTRNLPDHGLGRVTELAREVEAYALTYGGFDQLGPLLTLIDARG